MTVVVTRRINSDVIKEEASDILQQVTECKKPAYLYIILSDHDLQDNDHDTKAKTTFAVSFDDPPRDCPSITVAPHDTLDTIINRITRLA